MFIKRAKNKRKLLGEFPLVDFGILICLDNRFVNVVFICLNINTRI
jgi:predicted amidohydrolase